MPEKEFVKLLGALGADRLRIRLRTESGQLMDIVRYGTSHGFPHRDVMRPNGTKDKHSLFFPDLKTFLQYAEQDLKDRWSWYRERFLKEVAE